MSAECDEAEEQLTHVNDAKTGKKLKENPTCNGDMEVTPTELKNGNAHQDDSMKSEEQKNDSMMDCSGDNTDSKECEESIKDSELEKDIKINGESSPKCDESNGGNDNHLENEPSTDKKVLSRKPEAVNAKGEENAIADKAKSAVSDGKSTNISANKINGEQPAEKNMSNEVDESTKENIEGKKKVSKVTQVLKGAKAQTLNLRPIAQMLFDIGMDLTRQNVYRDLIKIQKKKDALDKLENKEKKELAMLGDSYDNLLQKNESFMMDSIQCSRCVFKTDSLNVLELHKEYAHDEEINLFTCAICGTSSNVVTAFLYHMESVHHRKGRLCMKHSFFVCPYCPYESNSRATFQKHMERCTKVFRESHNLVPLAPDCDIPLKQIKPPEKKAVKVASKPTPPPKPVIRDLVRPQPKPIIAPAMVPNKFQASRMPVHQQIAQRPALVTRSQPPHTLLASQQAPPAPPPPPPPPQAQNTNAASLVQMNGQWYRLTTIGAQQFLLPAPAPSVNQMPVTRPQIIVQNQLSTPFAQAQVQGKSGNFEVCEICGGFVKDRDSLRIHFYWAHKVDIHKDVFKAQVPPLSCPICLKTKKDVRFWTYQGLSRHRSTEHKDIPVSSVVTDRKAEPNGLMKEIPKQCVVCAHVYQNTTTPQLYWSHMEMHGITPAKLFLLRKCLICGVSISDSKRLEKHLLSAHASLFAKNATSSLKSPTKVEENLKESPVKSPSRSKPLIVCEMCKITFPTALVYQRHLDVVHTLKCSRCSQKLSSREVLMKHFHDVHGNEKDTCPICQQSVRIGRSMVRHIKSEHVRACSVSLVRLSKSEFVKHLEKGIQHFNENSPKESRTTKRKRSSTASVEDVILIDLDASPRSQVSKMGKDRVGRGSSKKQILEVDGEEIVVEIQQDAESDESDGEESTRSAIVLDDTQSDNGIASTNTVKTNKEHADDKAESDQEDCEVPPEKEQIELSDGDEENAKNEDMNKTSESAPAEDKEEQAMICEEVSSEESDDEVAGESDEEESVAVGEQDAESINISSEDDEEVVEQEMNAD